MNNDMQHTLLLVSLIIAGLVALFVVFKSPLEEYIPVLRTSGNPTQENKEQNNTEGEKEINDELPEEFVVTELIRIPWGGGEGEVGLFDPYSEGRVGDFGPLMGPDSFDIDENGNVYVLDTVNGRVLKFSPEGTYLSTVNIAKVTPNDLRVRNGKIYVFDRGAEGVWEYSAEGEFLKSYPLPRVDIYYGFYFDYQEQVLVGLRDDKTFYYLRLDNLDNDFPLYIGGVPSQHENVALSAFELSKAEIDILDQDGKWVRGINLEFPEITSTKRTNHRLLGTDEHGNIFVNYAYRNKDDTEWLSELWKFSQAGELLARASISNFLSTHEKIDFIPFIDFRLSRTGELYVPRFSRDMVRIFKFTSIKQ